MSRKKIIVIGGGPAGMMAAGHAAMAGCHVTLLEKMKSCGRKLSITGKGRCNLTNVADLSDFSFHFGDTATFLSASFKEFFADDLCDFVRSLGIDLEVERGGRVFPASGRATDVTDALRDWLGKQGVDVVQGSRVTEIVPRDGRVGGVRAGDRFLAADAIVLATGGASYPRTGSCGDGYRLAELLGHEIVQVRPALVPLLSATGVTGSLAGLELRNVKIRLLAGGRDFECGPGEMSFTERGVTGPLVLGASLYAVDAIREGVSAVLSVDLKPARLADDLVARLKRIAEESSGLTARELLRRVLPGKLVPMCLDDANIAASRGALSLTDRDMCRIVAWMKSFRIEITGYGSWDEAIVTAGGVSTFEVDQTTMESGKLQGLYFAGEVLDIQADTGGYNLQAAFSTGYVAGLSAAAGRSRKMLLEKGSGHQQKHEFVPEDEARMDGCRPPVTPRAGSERCKAKQTDVQTEREQRSDTGDSNVSAFLPMTKKEMQDRGWHELDVILVTGDAYIDSPFVGVAVIGRVLESAGYRVGIISQPDTATGTDIAQLGEPRLFWGVSGGCIDSLVANRTASGRPRRKDDYTPGGVNDRRPDRAAIVYSNLIRQHFKNTSPIVLGGIEASLRRVAHYDYWTDKIRRSILFDAKADYLLYGMGERAAGELAVALDKKEDPTQIRGLCYIRNAVPQDAVELPSFSECRSNGKAFTEMFHTFYRNNDPLTARTLAQQQDSRYLIQNPPAHYLQSAELDAVHELPYTRDAHPLCSERGKVRALETIRCSISTHRGCYGECNFCAITVHQGRAVRWRSEKSILSEAASITGHPRFKGVIQDVGGPTANMYGCGCSRMEKTGCCPNKRCIYPQVCSGLKVDHGRQLSLLRKLRRLPGVRQVVVASGIRHDLVIADAVRGDEYLCEIVEHHVSGQLKVAPEHSEPNVLRAMGKPGTSSLRVFKKKFDSMAKKAEKKAFLTYYLIAAHPGCTEKDMLQLRKFAARELDARPEQVQIFTPTPSTYSTLMYWTERDPFTGEPCFVEKTVKGREAQKNVLRIGKAAG